MEYRQLPHGSENEKFSVIGLSLGGRSPTKSEIRYVTMDDPVAYVQAQEPGCELEVTHDNDGTIVIKLDHNGLWVKYEFTEA